MAACCRLGRKLFTKESRKYFGGPRNNYVRSEDEQQPHGKVWDRRGRLRVYQCGGGGPGTVADPRQSEVHAAKVHD